MEPKSSYLRMSGWLTERQAAAHLNMSRKWLQKARLTGEGPRFAKFGSAVRYAVADIEEFERSSLRHSTSDHCARSKETQ